MVGAKGLANGGAQERVGEICAEKIAISPGNSVGIIILRYRQLTCATAGKGVLPARTLVSNPLSIFAPGKVRIASGKIIGIGYIRFNAVVSTG